MNGVARGQLREAHMYSQNMRSGSMNHPGFVGELLSIAVC
jgi:hypothetical protein